MTSLRELGHRTRSKRRVTHKNHPTLNKYFELKNSWGCRPNSNYLLKLSIAGQSSCAPGPRHVSLLVHAVKHAYKHTIPAFTHAGLHSIGTLCKHVCLNVNNLKASPTESANTHEKNTGHRSINVQYHFTAFVLSEGHSFECNAARQC